MAAPVYPKAVPEGRPAGGAPRWTLRSRMAALLIGVAMLPLALAAVIELNRTEAQLRDATADLLQARAAELVRDLDSFHRGHQRSVQRLAQFPPTLALCAAGPAELAARRTEIAGLLAAFPASDPAIGAVAVIDAHGVVLAATRPSINGTDLSFRPHVREALAGRSVISEVYVSLAQPDGIPNIAYAVPVAGPPGGSNCVALLAVRAAALWDRVAASNHLAGQGSFAVMFDRDGVRIAHSYTQDIVFHPAGALEPATIERMVAERRFGPRTRELLADVRPFPQQFERARAAAPDTAMFEGFAPVNEARNYGVARRLETVPWTAFYMVPQAVLDARIAQARRAQWMLATPILAGALLAGLWFASRLARPIRDLTDATRRLAAGDAQARVVGGRNDELGELGESFNAMAQRIETQAAALQHSHDELEQRVADRTAQLERTTAELHEQVLERERLDALRLRLAAIVDGTDDAIVGKTLDGIVTSWNTGAERLFGYRADEMVGQPIQRLMPPDRLDEERQIIARILRGESVEHFETVRRHASGRPIEVSVTISPIRDAQGRIVGASKIARDIGERNAVQRRLQAQLERLSLLDQITRAIGERQDLQSIYQVVVRSLEERMPLDFSCLCNYDAPTQTLTVVRVGVHSAALAMEIALQENASFQIDANGLARCVRGQLVYEPDLAAVDAPFPRRLARGGLHAMVVAPLQAESGVFGVLVAARASRESFSSVECEFLRQLTAHVALAAQQARLHAELRLAYEELQQTQQASLQQERLRALGQMASGVAHDINNALSPASLYTQSLLEREPGLSPRARLQLENIQRAIDDVAATVGRMNEFSRRREAQAVLQPMSLNAVAQQAAEMTRARWSDMALQRGVVIRLQVDAAPVLPDVMGIESEIREALVNLVFNAVDAMPQGGDLTLRTRLAADGARPVRLEVVDTGIGMDDETRRRCLEPFFTTKGERGSGLGLAMVYGTAKRHDAEVQIDSTPGQGSRFVLSFPLPAAARAAVAVKLRVRPPVLPRRLLVIDDDPLVLRTLSDLLQIDGHAVTPAHGGQAGIEAFAAAAPPFDLVITDLGMPHVDGRRVAAVIKARSPRTPVVLLTGWGQRLSEAGELPENVDAVLPKPPLLDDLRDTLARLGAPLDPLPHAPEGAT
ncbi:PAS domain S-box protein [Rhizobacter sp. OV335]|uniref:PAS domain S-box protein n=1 Tax=Rhizobacter sp. OV335 TaxID=1500264 RepID=UPI00090F54BF|nr:PAS domain S-box protein [Rhizobacter sp. OV335]SHM56420.1 PAS domain S-box-containing protein [Rhizobacter sp. OV335]